ncbi:RNA-guided endonuclease TnpB family protein [Microvirga sp. VF16]|uniref:RNA-guided endonuclease InsQ/TnpB family protein n=1 Tax=Microvirga sp. VF16 TaxID=2807101 RepID=UPI00193EAD64|nr:RNA-guided endonuclease TnpB family protein [Microvirga sp. VF16]QRM35656.1 transposase [Microvirga sp. VF16]
MKVRKAYRFRIYPTLDQIVLLCMTIGCCRLVYNLALEQRRLFSRKGRSLNYNTGANDLPALKREFPFFADAPSQCLQQALRDLEDAFQRFFQKTAGYPKPRRKFVYESCRFPQGFTIERHRLKLPKFGWLKMAAHRRVKGRPTSVTVSREGDRWYASIACEVDVPNPQHREIAEVGVDLNVITGAVSSDGAIRPMPRVTPQEMRQLARLQKSLDRKKKGSSNRMKARRALARFHAKLARRRRNAAHVISCQIAKKHTHVAFEDLRLKPMTASAKGTLSEPGRNVAAKAGLNRSILDVSPGQIRSMTKYKTAWSGGECVEVDARHTSQRCSECGQHPQDDASTEHLPHGRVTRDRFVCPLCGYEAHADINAARNILALGRHRWSASWTTAGGAPVAACGGLRTRRAREAGTKDQGIKRLAA